MAFTEKTKKRIQDEAYASYQLRWMADHGYSVADLIGKLAGINVPDAATPEDRLEAFRTGCGFDGRGRCWKSKQDFLSSDYPDRDAMYPYLGLMDPESHAIYLSLWLENDLP